MLIRRMLHESRNTVKRTRCGTVLGLTNQLGLLARLYGGSDKGWHGYLPLYERHFGPLRLRRNRVLEIGVGGYENIEPTGSLCIWRDYFLRSRILGLDLHEKAFDLGTRVLFQRGDQGDPGDLDRAIERLGVPNIVIDDGSHVGRHIVASFSHLFPLMPYGSVYVIEDLSTSYYPSFEGGIPAPDNSAVGLLKVLVDSVQARDRTFSLRRNWGGGPEAVVKDVQTIHLYPGVAFIEKRVN